MNLKYTNIIKISEINSQFVNVNINGYEAEIRKTFLRTHLSNIFSLYEYIKQNGKPC